MNLHQIHTCFWRNRGAASVELVIFIPIMLILIIGIGTVAKVLDAILALESAMRVGLTTAVAKLGDDQHWSCCRDADGNVTVPSDVIGAAQDSAIAESPYLISSPSNKDAPPVVNVFCRCPLFDVSTPVSDILSCGDSEILLCEMHPIVYLEMQASVYVDLAFSGFGIGDNPVPFGPRTLIMAVR